MSEAFYTDKRQVRAAFERAALSYDAAAVLQREVSERMQERLLLIRHQPQRVLDLGSGTGFGARSLRTRYESANIIECDLAPAMLVQARRMANDGHWLAWLRRRAGSYVCADMEALPLAANSVDMIWSNLALQWCNQPDQAFAEMLRVLKPGGLLMFSTFGPDTLKELRHIFAGVDEYTHVNRFIDMHDLGDALIHTGFETPVMDMEFLQLTYSSMREALRDLKAIGAHNVTLGRPQGLMGKARWRNAEQRYETLRRDGRLPLTYEVVYGHAWKPQPKVELPAGYQPVKFPGRTR